VIVMLTHTLAVKHNFHGANFSVGSRTIKLLGVRSRNVDAMATKRRDGSCLLPSYALPFSWCRQQQPNRLKISGSL
jgi:hypothetical protein